MGSGSEVLKGIFGKVGVFVVYIIEFIFKQKLFHMISFVAFATTIIQAVMMSINQTPPDPVQSIYIGKVVLNSFLNLGKIVLFVDNQIYILSRQFSNLANPLLWDAFLMFMEVMRNIVFYVWWYKVFSWIFKEAGGTIGAGTDQSTGKVDLFKKIIGLYIIFFTLMNFLGLFATGVIHWDIPATGSFLSKIKFFFDTNFISAFDFVFKMIPFKGLIHFIVFSLGKMIKIVVGVAPQTGLVENVSEVIQ